MNDELWSIYGDLGNRRVQGIRSTCRERLTGMTVLSAELNAKRDAEESSKIANAINFYDGSDHAKEKAESMEKVFEWWSERPEELADLVQSHYRDLYGDGYEYQGNNSIDGSTQCPWESKPQSKTPCWGCKLPQMVFNDMEKIYERDHGDS